MEFCKFASQRAMPLLFHRVSCHKEGDNIQEAEQVIEINSAKVICYSSLTNCLWGILKKHSDLFIKFFVLFCFFFWDSAPYRTHRIISNPSQKTTVSSVLILEMKVCKNTPIKKQLNITLPDGKRQWNRTDLTLEWATLYITWSDFPHFPTQLSCSKPNLTSTKFQQPRDVFYHRDLGDAARECYSCPLCNTFPLLLSFLPAASSLFAFSCF